MQNKLGPPKQSCADLQRSPMRAGSGSGSGSLAVVLSSAAPVLSSSTGEQTPGSQAARTTRARARAGASRVLIFMVTPGHALTVVTAQQVASAGGQTDREPDLAHACVTGPKSVTLIRRKRGPAQSNPGGAGKSQARDRTGKRGLRCVRV